MEVIAKIEGVIAIMGIRETGYSDYGITEAELKELLEAIRNEPNMQLLFLNACFKANESLANELYYSLAGKVSYEDLVRVKYIPLAKSDFYAYRRKAVATFKKLKKKRVIKL